MRSPQPTLYFENKAGRLLEEPAGYLRAFWSPGEREPLAFRALFNHMVLALRRHGWHRILVDQRQMRAFSAAEQQWIAQQWLPRAVTEGGYRYGAVIVSEDVFTRLATAYVTTSVQELPLVYRTFTEEATAVAWLLAQE
jgi:hypothetical protein